MSTSEWAAAGHERGTTSPALPRERREPRTWLSRLLIPLAQPRIAGLVALCLYLLRAALNSTGLHHSDYAYFNYLADAFLHGQLSLRLTPEQTVDLVSYGGQLYLYWAPFPALLILPLVAVFGVGVSDVVYTAILSGISIALLARLFAALDATGIAPLNAERRGLLVATGAFGTVVLILAPIGAVWFTAQIVGWVCVLLATVATLALEGKRAYFLTGLALACALATRFGLLFTGLWLAYYLLARDWRLPWSQRLARVACGLAPLVVTLLLLGWYNTARFGNPLNMGLAWHNVGPWFADEFARYGVFSLHYVPTNLYYHFVAPPMSESQVGIGGGLFWMTPILAAAPSAVARGWRRPLVWALALSCLLVYVPVVLVMGTGYLYGSRYLLDLQVPLLVLTAIGIGRWRRDVLQLLLLIGCASYLLGSALMLFASYS